MWVSKPKSIHFVAYISSKRPDGKPLDSNQRYYAVPGRGVSQEETIREWAKENNVKVSFS